MKRVLTTMLFLFVVHYGWSQIEMKLKPRTPIQDTDSIVVGRDGVQIWKKPFHTLNATLVNSDSSQFSHSVPAGTVYVSRQDGMYWLKPNTTLVHNMPVDRNAGNGIMPNAFVLKREL